MRRLRILLVAAVFAALVTTALFAQRAPEPVTPDEFRRVINFDDSIATLARLVRDQAFDRIDVTRYYVLEGSVASTQIFDPNPDTFQAVVELVASEWIGLEEIEVYHIFVLVEGPDFAARFPERLPRDPGPEVVQTNQRIMVVGPFIGTAMLDASTEVAVIQAVALR